MTPTFEEFLATSSANIQIIGFIINIIISALLATVLSHVYAKYGNSLSNREQFGRNFLLITMSTVLIISIVKSSLALSLGLVGALSVIRFRAAIKEPEELAYLFFAIGIGLGLGANQTLITFIAFIIIISFLIFQKKYVEEFQYKKNLHLTIGSDNAKKISIDTLLGILKKNCDVVDLRRLDETKEIFEASFMIEVRDFKQLNKAKNEIQKLNESLTITFLDNKGFIS